jgi:hypothetical protein
MAEQCVPHAACRTAAWLDPRAANIAARARARLDAPRPPPLPRLPLPPRYGFFGGGGASNDMDALEVRAPAHPLSELGRCLFMRVRP